jgi:DNA polymerase III subunit chi
MTDVGFYHLTRSTVAESLPQLLTRTLAAGQRALVVAGGDERLAALSKALWSQPAWLPHGSASDGDAELQPIWLSTEPAVPNGARYLFLIDGAAAELGAFDRVFDLFDGGDEQAVAMARERWRSAKLANHTLTYWQQTATGWRKQSS